MYKILKGSKVVLFGAGRSGRTMLKWLMNNDIAPAYFVDNNPDIKFVEYDDKMRVEQRFAVNVPQMLLDEDKRTLMIIIAVGPRRHAEIKTHITGMGLEECLFSEKRICPACRSEVDIFLPYGKVLRKDAQCPNCRALERHRALWLYFEKYTNLFTDLGQPGNVKVLHFAPEKVFYDKFSKLSGIDYYPVDINPSKKGLRDVIDIQLINYSDAEFDVVICSHVLDLKQA